MRLSTVCIVALGAVFLAGLLPSLFAQAELAGPGLQVVGVGGERNYNIAVAIHTLIFAGLLPLSGIALALAVIGEARDSGIAKIAAIGALAAAPLLALALVAGVFQTFPLPGPWWLSLAPPDMLVLLQAVVGLVSLVLVAALVPLGRSTAIVFAALSGIAILLGASMQLVLANAGLDHALLDTYYVLGANHEAGVSITLNILGSLTVWSIRWEGLKRTWFSLAAGGAILATGTLAALAAGGLGLMGMPRRYVDYPSAFGAQQGVLALWSMAFAAVLVAAILWLFIATWRAKRPPGVETAFD